MIYILLPAYNEEDAVNPLAAKISAVMAELESPYEIVVVNDGSADGTAPALARLAADYPIRVLSHKYNRGLGETIRDGMEYIAEVADPDDVIIRMDCDDTHDPKYIPSMLARLAEGYDVVIASRYAPGGGQEGLDWYRRTISRCANLMFKTAFPIKGVWEYTCGFRAYRAAIIQDALAIFGNKFIDLKGLGFTGTLEKLIKLYLIGAKVGEIPFVLRYDQKLSVSKVVTSITTLGCFILMIKHCRYWADEGKRWKAAIAARKARVAAEERVYTRVLPSTMSMRQDAQHNADLAAVRSFWEAHPLFEGEATTKPGELAFYEEHERMTLAEHSGEVDPIFTRDLRPGKRVLDVGCGIGFWVGQFGPTGAELHACDLTERAVDLTRQRAKLYGIRADVRVGNAERLPYPDAYFDHVNCQGVIHHTPDPQQCIREFARVVKPGGTICFSVYYKPLVLRSRLLFRTTTKLLRPFVKLPGRGREGILGAGAPDELVRMYDGADNPIGKAYTRAELLQMLGPGIRVVEEKRIGFPRRVFPFPIPTAFHKLLSRYAGLMLVMRCEREMQSITPAHVPTRAPVRMEQVPVAAES